jgi:hypothetical protein
MTNTLQQKKNRLIADTLTDYSKNAELEMPGRKSGRQVVGGFNDDEQFWKSFFDDPEKFWDKQINLELWPVVSDWVARVPGLFWLDDSKIVRAVSDIHVESREMTFRSPNWIQYSPIGKSKKVLGGFGTFNLPPNDDGKRIMTITFSHNASAGIPALVFPDVIDAIHLEQGDMLTFNKPIYWRRMSSEWIGKFDNDVRVKRGYLVIDDPNSIKIKEKKCPVEVHPFSIMEYSQDGGAGMFYDYVYCSVDNLFEGYRHEITRFFENYRTQHGRYGEYLIAADSNNPLFESRFNSPSELLRTSNGRSNLSLLRERILGKYNYRGYNVQKIQEYIPQRFVTELRISSLANMIGVPAGRISGESASERSVSLIDYCDQNGKLDLLVDEMLK